MSLNTSYYKGNDFKKLLKNLKKSLKIRDFSKKNKVIRNYNKKEGITPKGTNKLASFREDVGENQKLQSQTKNPNAKGTTYTRVTSKNKAELSNQHKKKDVKKTGSTDNKSKLKAGSAREKLRAKNVKRFGKAHVDRLVAKNKEFQAAKKDKKKMKAYREKYGKK